MSKMRYCRACGCTARHTNMDNGWTCDNCGNHKPIQVQGQNTPKAIQAIIDKLTFETEYGESWRGYVTLDELRMLLVHNTMREVKISADPFGLVALDKRSIEYFINDDYRKRRQVQLEEKTGRPVEASISLYQDRKASGWTHRMYIFQINAYIDETRERFYPFS